MFAYYAKWIHNFSDKIRQLVENTKFLLETKVHETFKQIKQELEITALKPIYESLPLEVECDVAISAALNRGGRPVAFMSKTLQGRELKYHIIEKEAIEIMEAVRKWSHYLTRQHFTLITDQRSVAFMFSHVKYTKIKNVKIQEWRLELSTLAYTIKYRPGKKNVVPDTLSRAFTCSLINSSTLVDLHNGLCHPGITGLCREKPSLFYGGCKKRVSSSYRICARFHIPPEGTLIKATRPMEKLSIGFKGPVPSVTSNTYLLVVDKYSRFPFVFPCPNMYTTTIIKALDRLFSLTGMPCDIHTDRGMSFMSKELRDYHVQKGVETSNTTSYHPAGNAQVERNLTEKYLELVSLEVLHSARSLL